MRALKENTRRLFICGVAFAAGISLVAYVVSKFLQLTPPMRSSFTGWVLILVMVTLLVVCTVYGVLGVGFGFRLSDTLTEGDGRVIWRFGFDTSLGDHENRFVLLHSSSGLWIIKSHSKSETAASLRKTPEKTGSDL